MVDFLKRDNDGKLTYCHESESQYVLISINEYNGYEKALEIVRNRALQEIDRSKADEYGYKLVKAEKRRYRQGNRKVDNDAWFITKSTPYSLKMSVKQARAMIERDLRDFYNLRDMPVIRRNEFGYTEKLSVRDLLDYHERFFRAKMDRSHIGNDAMLKALDWMDRLGGLVIFDLVGLTPNYAAGCYEVRYWATMPI